LATKAFTCAGGTEVVVVLAGVLPPLPWRERAVVVAVEEEV
jgi:hypothetical protein